MTTPKPPAGYGTNKIEQQPPRTYSIPGGPLARDLGEVEVAQLAEIKRGGDDDAGYGNRR